MVHRLAGDRDSAVLPLSPVSRVMELHHYPVHDEHGTAPRVRSGPSLQAPGPAWALARWPTTDATLAPPTPGSRTRDSDLSLWSAIRRVSWSRSAVSRVMEHNRFCAWWNGRPRLSHVLSEG